MRFSEWRARKWGGPCSSPASPQEVGEYSSYLRRESGMPEFEELF